MWLEGQTGWLRQSPLIIGVPVIRRLMLSQEPGKGAGFLQGSERNFPAITRCAALSCPGDVLADRHLPPACSLVTWWPAGKHSK